MCSMSRAFVHRRSPWRDTVFAVDASAHPSGLIEAAKRARRQPKPTPKAAEYAKAREEYGVFEHRRNPGRQLMYSAGLKRKSAVRETELAR